MRQPKFIPILMSTPMVVANLNDIKNQTRRIPLINKGKWTISHEANDSTRTDLDAYGVLDENKNYV